MPHFIMRAVILLLLLHLKSGFLMESVSQANSGFALDLYRALSASSPDTNLFFSPLSVSAALALTYLGARTNTAEEMEKVLGFSSVPDVHTQFNSLINAINKPESSYTLRMATRLYGEKTFNFLLAFVVSAQKLYEAGLETVDFAGAPDETLTLINRWVEEKTENKIKDLLKPGTLDSSTQLILVNAIYFKGTWQKKFNSQLTKQMPFKINQKETRPVQMMFQTEEFLYRDIPEYKLQVLELPYLKHELSMLVLLPDETQDGSDPLQKLESDLTVDKLLDWTDPKKMPETAVDVLLPKFKVEEHYSLKETLKKMGMKSLFQKSAADLSGMSLTKGLFVSAVDHKTFIDVNEKGTEAAAATGITFVLESAFISSAQFKADHPFLFFIRHNSSNSILFMGRFEKPL